MLMSRAAERENFGARSSTLSMTEFDPELPVVNGSFRQFGAHGWQEPDGVRMRARRTARSA